MRHLSRGLPLLAFAMATALGAQQRPDSTPPARLPASTLAAFPVKTFLENLLVLPDGAVLVTCYPEGVVYRVDQQGAVSRFAQLPGTIAGIARRADGSLLVTGWRDGKVPSVFELSASGAVGTITPIPGAAFPNGITPLEGEAFLIADSYRGVVWRWDAAARTATTWLADTLLARRDTTSPYPGVNGVHRVGSMVYVSNTQRGMILAVALDGARPRGALRPVAGGVPIDDFAVASDGSIYAATHPLNSIVRFSPTGVRTTVGTIEDGLAGSTSAVIAVAGGHRMLLVTTNGGMSAPPPGGIQPGRLVRLDLGAVAR